MHKMWTHAYMAHHWHAGIGNRLDDLELLAPALHLHTVDGALFHEAQRVDNRNLRVGKAAIGHRDEAKRVGRPPRHRLAVLDHIDGHRQRVRETVAHHAETVADR